MSETVIERIQRSPIEGAIALLRAEGREFEATEAAAELKNLRVHEIWSSDTIIELADQLAQLRAENKELARCASEAMVKADKINVQIRRELNDYKDCRHDLLDKVDALTFELAASQKRMGGAVKVIYNLRQCSALRVYGNCGQCEGEADKWLAEG